MESKYYENIIYVRDKKTNTIIIPERCKINKIASIYSNTKQPIFKLIIDDTPISRNNTYTVKYKCMSCSLESEITLNLYMRKVNKNITRCDACRNKDNIKCKAHSEFMKNNATAIITGDYTNQPVRVKKLTLDEHLDKSKLDWDNECDEFKERYFMRHLTQDEFQRISDKIVSINNDKFNDIENWIYHPYYRVYNQSRYTPMLINKENKCSEKPLYIKFKCDNCDSLFIHRDIYIVKNHYKLYCQTCSLTNKTFRIRKLALKNGDKIMWQSIPERRFIEWCISNNIIIKNGPQLPYTFKEKTHIYRVDFELPHFKMLIEIKDNHCWHIKQVESGKFGCKDKAAKDWCIKNNYTYHVIFPKTLQKLKDSILSSISL